MKKTKLIYWIVTGLFAAVMISTSVPNVLNSEESLKFLGHLGYPAYFVPFIGVAKILGSITILIPGLKRLKEWAYAGLFFDLAGAVFSIVATDGFQPQMLFMLVFFGLFFGSYYLHLKTSEATA